MNTHNKLFRFVALGEILWDVFPSGRVFGGAPANFACSTAEIARTVTEVGMISAVGQDELGNEALNALQERGVVTQFVQRVSQPTGRVDVELLADKSASYKFAKDCAWDNLAWDDSLQEHLDQTHAICFGTLAQRSTKSRATIQKCIESTNQDTLIVFDINLRPPFHTDTIIMSSLEQCNVLKLNEEELPIVAKLAGIHGTTHQQLTQLAHQFGLKAIALTLGPRGAVLFRDGELSECAGIDTNVVDTVGAGDAFTGQFVLGLLLDWELERINRRAIEVAAYVCSQKGATPSLPDRFQVS